MKTMSYYATIGTFTCMLSVPCLTTAIAFALCCVATLGNLVIDRMFPEPEDE